MMKIELTGKQSLVTGSTAGIGLAIAQGLAEAGASVTIVGRDQAKVDKALAEIANASGRDDAKGIIADPGTAEGCRTIIEQLPEVDVLVNNLGIYGGVPFFDIDDAAWEEIFQVNVMSGVRLARHYATGMKARGWGRIQFISSESALNIPTEMVHYGFSKTAQLAISRGLARLSKGTNVTVNSVLPGPTMSRANANDLKETAKEKNTSVEKVVEAFFEERRPTSLIQRFAETEEVANMVVYVASPLSAATNGAALRVDGGVANYIV